MNYKEIHLINNTFIIPPNYNEDYKYCPREEIVHPVKLQIIVENIPIQWDTHDYNNETYNVAWFPWCKKYTLFDSCIYSSVFHILIEKPALFATFNRIVSNKVVHAKELTQWLQTWWDTPFLITTPIFHSIHGPFICKSSYPPTKKSLDRHIPQEYLNLQLDNQSYTFGNGLILLLAYHRLGILSARITTQVIEPLLKNNPEYIYQNVTDKWHWLYYGTRISHITDFPAYYLCMGPNFAHINIVRRFKSYMDFHFSLDMTTHYIQYTSPFSAMFPYFNSCLWKELSENNNWLDCDPAMYEYIYADMNGFVNGILSTKRSWKYWLVNYISLLNDLVSTCVSIEKLLEDIFYICSYNYIYGSSYSSKRYKGKIRQFWNTCLVVLDKNKLYSYHILKRYALKYQLFEKMTTINRHTTIIVNEFPYALLKDINAYSEINSYYKTNYIIMTPYINILRLFYEDIQIHIPEEDETSQNLLILTLPKYTLSRSIIQLFKEASPRSTMCKFYDSYIHRRIISRLCAIYRGFGMYMCGGNINIESSVYDKYLVGVLLIEFLKNNKNLLVE